MVRFYSGNWKLVVSIEQVLHFQRGFVLEFLLFKFWLFNVLTAYHFLKSIWANTWAYWGGVRSTALLLALLSVRTVGNLRRVIVGPMFHIRMLFRTKNWSLWDARPGTEGSHKSLWWRFVTIDHVLIHWLTILTYFLTRKFDFLLLR